MAKNLAELCSSVLWIQNLQAIRLDYLAEEFQSKILKEWLVNSSASLFILQYEERGMKKKLNKKKSKFKELENSKSICFEKDW